MAMLSSPLPACLATFLDAGPSDLPTPAKNALGGLAGRAGLAAVDFDMALKVVPNQLIHFERRIVAA